MDPYNRLRGAMGFPIDYELGRAVGNNENKRKAIFAGCKNYVFKLVCEKEGVVVGHFNGFCYTNEPPLILTSGHIVGFAGASKYFACFFEGTDASARVELQLIKTGRLLGAKQTSSGVTFNEYSPDAAVFQIAPTSSSSVQPVATPRPFAASASVGDTAFIVGFKARDEPQLSFSEGVVSYTGLSVLHTTAHADDGYSGSPVFNSEGFIIGMVLAGEGSTIKYVVAVPAAVLHTWLTTMHPVCPGFSG